jgi:hypothetical protein
MKVLPLTPGAEQFQYAVKKNGFLEEERRANQIFK